MSPPSPPHSPERQPLLHDRPSSPDRRRQMYDGFTEKITYICHLGMGTLYSLVLDFLTKFWSSLCLEGKAKWGPFDRNFWKWFFFDWP